MGHKSKTYNNRRQVRRITGINMHTQDMFSLKIEYIGSEFWGLGFRV